MREARFRAVEKVLKWARKNSLWYFNFSTGCCPDELLDTVGCRYDLERFGCIQKQDPRQADLLIVSGAITQKSAPYLKEVYEVMLNPKYVMAIGSCASTGGAYCPPYSDAVIPGVQNLIPVDIFVVGCPPRPEAIMHGIIKLQEKISESNEI